MPGSQFTEKVHLQFFVGNLCKTQTRERIYNALTQAVYVANLDLPLASPSDAKYKKGDKNRGYAVVTVKTRAEVKKMLKKGTLMIGHDRASITAIDMQKKSAHMENRRTRQTTRAGTPTFDFAKFASAVDSGVPVSPEDERKAPLLERDNAQMRALQDQLPRKLEQEIARRREKCELLLSQNYSSSSSSSGSPTPRDNAMRENVHSMKSQSLQYVNTLHQFYQNQDDAYMQIYSMYVREFAKLYQTSQSPGQFVDCFGQLLGAFTVDAAAKDKELQLLRNCC
jgi:hypothetical protein